MEVDEGQGEAGEAEDGLYGGHRVEDSLAEEPPHQEHLPHLTTYVAGALQTPGASFFPITIPTLNIWMMTSSRLPLHTMSWTIL